VFLTEGSVYKGWLVLKKAFVELFLKGVGMEVSRLIEGLRRLSFL